MQFGLSLFSNFIAPLIMIIAFLSCLWRLHSMKLLLLTVVITAFIVLSTSNPLFVTVRNPYLMLSLSGLLLFDVALLSRVDETDKPYLIAANVVVLIMIAALHAWNISLRETDLYFYEQSSAGTIAYYSIISLMSLALPVIAFLRRNKPGTG